MLFPYCFSYQNQFTKREIAISFSGDNKSDGNIIANFKNNFALVTKHLDWYKGHLRQFIVDDKGAIIMATFGLRGNVMPSMSFSRILWRGYTSGCGNRWIEKLVYNWSWIYNQIVCWIVFSRRGYCIEIIGFELLKSLIFKIFRVQIHVQGRKYWGKKLRVKKLISLT